LVNPTKNSRTANVTGKGNFSKNLPKGIVIILFFRQLYWSRHRLRRTLVRWERYSAVISELTDYGLADWWISLFRAYLRLGMVTLL